MDGRILLLTYLEKLNLSRVELTTRTQLARGKRCTEDIGAQSLRGK